MATDFDCSDERENGVLVFISGELPLGASGVEGAEGPAAGRLSCGAVADGLIAEKNARIVRKDAASHYLISNLVHRRQASFIDYASNIGVAVTQSTCYHTDTV